MNEETMKLIEEKEGEIRALTNLLEQGDYKARKLLAEVCVIVKAQFPNAQMPVYDRYLAEEQKAQSFRDEINKLQAEIEELKKS